MRIIAMLSATALTAAVGLVVVTRPAAARPSPSPGTTPFAISQANDALRSHANQFAAAAADEFTPRSVVIDTDGAAHVHLDRTHRGLPVLGGDVIAHLDRAGALRSATRSLPAPITLPVVARIDAAGANAAATAAFHGTAAHQPTLAVDALVTPPTLVWHTTVVRTTVGTATVTTAGADDLASTVHVLIGAGDGSVVDSWDELENAEGTGTGFSSGVVPLTTTFAEDTYQLKDPTRGNGTTADLNNRTSGSGTLFTDTDNIWGTGTLDNRQTIAVDAQYGTAVTWDYYLNTFNRKGIADDGVGAPNLVHYGTKFNNAGWSNTCFCMVYGDGDGTTFNPFASLDVAGHEMTHGVTSRTAGLVYSGESGGLNESLSDIFGSLVEFYAGNPADPGDYLIGEKIRKSGTPLRFMNDPSKDGKSASCYSSDVGQLNVHNSSGVSNHAFFLLAVGSGAHTVNGVPYDSPTCDGSTVTGIGNATAGAIFYKALTSYMTSATSFAGARTATLSAASALYGDDSTEYTTVAAAWSAVNVH